MTPPCSKCGSPRSHVRRGSAWPGAKMGPAIARVCDDCGTETPLSSTAPRCRKCGADLTDAPRRPAYAPPTDPGLLCVPCDAAAWRAVDESAKSQPPAVPGVDNVWD